MSSDSPIDSGMEITPYGTYDDFCVIYKNGICSRIYSIKDKKLFSDIEYQYVYSAMLLFIDDTAIDIRKIDDIEKIDTGIEIGITSTSVGRLDNDLRFQAYNLRQLGYYPQSLKLLKKALDISERYIGFWKPNIFMYYAEYLYEDDRDEEADEYCKHIKDIVYAYNQYLNDLPKTVFTKIMKVAADLHLDYVELGYKYSASEECAKHRARIYSISGKDKRFPKLPEYVKANGRFCSDCMCKISLGSEYCLSIYAGVDENGKSIEYKGKEAIRYSNRPFIDDRTPEEIESYERWKNELDKIKTENLYIDFEKRVRRKGKRQKAYRLICENFPEIAPKSINGFANMQNHNTKNYQTLRAKMLDKGIDIEN